MADFKSPIQNHILASLLELQGRAMVTYPEGDANYPRVERVMQVPREDWRLEWLTADAEYTDCKLTEQRLVGGDDIYVRVWRVWECVPGPVIVTYSNTPEGLMRVETQRVAYTGSDPEVGVDVASSFLSGEGKITLMKQTSVPIKRKIDGNMEDGWALGQEKRIGGVDPIPEKFRKFIEEVETVTQHELAQGEVEDIPDPSALTGDEFEKTHRKVNDFRYEKRVRERKITTDTSPLVGSEVTSQFGGAVVDVEESVVLDSVKAEGGYLVVSDSVDPMVGGKAIRRRVVKPPDIVGGVEQGWPVLQSVEMDEIFGIPILVEKKFVAPPANPLATMEGGVITEYKEYDKWKSIQIVSKIDLTNLSQYNRERPATMNYSFPDVLREYNLEGDVDGANKWQNIRLRTHIQEGYSGPCDARIVESFHTSIPSRAPGENITRFWPLEHRVGLEWGKGQTVTIDGTTTSSTSAFEESTGINAVLTQVYIPRCLHDAITIDFPVRSFDANSGWVDHGTIRLLHLNATTPATLPYDGEIVAGYDIEPYRFGIFIKRVTYLKVPAAASNPVFIVTP